MNRRDNLALQVQVLARAKTDVFASIHPDRVAASLGLNVGMAADLLREGNRVRARLIDHVCGIAGVETRHTDPSLRPALVEEAALKVGLAVYLSSHPGVFMREDYRALLDTFGNDTVQFAVKAKATIQGLLPRVPGLPSREAVERLGRFWLIHGAAAYDLGLMSRIEAALPFDPQATYDGAPAPEDAARVRQIVLDALASPSPSDAIDE